MVHGKYFPIILTQSSFKERYNTIARITAVEPIKASWGRPVQEGEVNNLGCIIIDDRSGENFSVMVGLPRQIYTKNEFH